MRLASYLLICLVASLAVVIATAAASQYNTHQTVWKEDSNSYNHFNKLESVNISSCVPLSNGMCECTATQCDFVPPVLWNNITGNTIVSYRTAKAQKERLVRTVLEFTLTQSSSDDNKSTNNNNYNNHNNKAAVRNILQINATLKYQKMLGFGGAFTDAAAVNWMSLDQSLREIFIATYFAENGLQYSLGRIPIASCDFSTHQYSYDDTPGDLNMTNFSVLMDATSSKATLIQQAVKQRQLYGANMTLFGSSWSAPYWMKTSMSRVGGTLNGTAGDAVHKAYAKYLSLFITEYKKQFGLDISMLTVQNEPGAEPPSVTWDSMVFSAETERDFIKLDLGPTIKADHPDVLLMMHDDQRNTLPAWGKTILSDPEAAKYVDGAAFHWYEADQDLYPDFYNVGYFHGNFSDKFLLATEACVGYESTSRGPKLGDFDRGQKYLYDIIGDVNNWATGWTDWNICLSITGGPNWDNNFVDAPILIDPSKPDRFYKQPLFYAMGHVSSFVQPGSTRIDAVFTARDTAGLYGLEATAFLTPDNQHIVVVLLNRDPQIDRTLLITNVGGEGEGEGEGDNRTIQFDVPSHSMQTLIYSVKP